MPIFTVFICQVVAGSLWDGLHLQTVSDEIMRLLVCTWVYVVALLRSHIEWSKVLKWRPIQTVVFQCFSILIAEMQRFSVHGLLVDKFAPSFWQGKRAVFKEN